MSNFTGYDNPRTFHQLQYIGWPEHGTPNTTKQTVDLVKEILEMLTVQGTTSKILVHGSLGVGRTGTFIALLELLDSLDAKLSEFQQLERFIPKQADSIIEEANLDIFNCVINLRKQRCEMVSKRIFVHFT